MVGVLFATRKRDTPVVPLEPIDTKPIENELQEKVIKAEQEREKRYLDVSEGRKKAIEDQQQQLEEQAPVLLDDPEALNDYLHQVGKKK